MKLLFTCVECGKALGHYIGEGFYLTFSDADKIKGELKVICEECWRKRR